MNLEKPGVPSRDGTRAPTTNRDGTRALARPTEENAQDYLAYGTPPGSIPGKPGRNSKASQSQPIASGLRRGAAHSLRLFRAVLLHRRVCCASKAIRGPPIATGLRRGAAHSLRLFRAVLLHRRV